MDLKKLLLSFEGRIGRNTYWMCFLAFLGVALVAGFVFAMLGEAGVILQLVLLIPMIWCGLAIQAKRWHDRDKTAWWILIGLIPVIGPIWALVENGFLRGTEGANRFGPAPTAGAS